MQTPQNTHEMERRDFEMSRKSLSKIIGDAFLTLSATPGMVQTAIALFHALKNLRTQEQLEAISRYANAIAEMRFSVKTDAELQEKADHIMKKIENILLEQNSQ